MSTQWSGQPHAGPRGRTGGLAAAGVVLLAGVWLVSSQCDSTSTAAREHSLRPLPPDGEAVLLAPPPLDDEYFPCGDCHEGEAANPTVRELDEHDFALAHGDLWCLDCHDADRRGILQLSDESLVEFEDSWRLCTRCHGDRLDDWRAGIHGKRTGYWRGRKEYRTCVACHDPHSPRFEPLEPRPSPRPASEIRLQAHARQLEERDESP